MGSPRKRAQGVQEIASELEDADSLPADYSILTYPADFTLEILVKKLRSKKIVVPRFQRRFVWKEKQASRLIESFLVGLPVPPIFLYTDKEGEKMLVVDGQQRLQSVRYFFQGSLPPQNKGGERETFALASISSKSPYYNKTFSQLESAACERLKNTVLRAIVVKQLNPDDDTSLYHLFERLNTGGTLLQGQEIRNCIYQGEFAALLQKLNKEPEWREVFGKDARDERQRDVELILRFLALHFAKSHYKKPMKQFLNRFMATHKQLAGQAKKFEPVFRETLSRVFAALGKKPFHIHRGINVAVFDSVFLAFAANAAHAVPADIEARYKSLKDNPKYLDAVSSATTDVEVIHRRIDIASSELFGK